jgi:hypothetical protein
MEIEADCNLGSVSLNLSSFHFGAHFSRLGALNFCVLNARLTHAAATDEDLNWMARVVDDESFAIALAVVITCNWRIQKGDKHSLVQNAVPDAQTQ